MKYILKIVGFWGFAALCFSNGAFAQNNRSQGIGISFGANDFYGPQTNHYFGDNVTSINYNILTLKNDTSVTNKFRWDPMVRITYWWKYKNNWDFNLGLSIGNATYPSGSNDSAYQEIKRSPVSKYKIMVAEVDARANYNFWSKSKHIFTPYVFAGLTASHHPAYFGADLPVGLGLNINLDKKSKDIYLNLDAGYKLALTANDFNHVQYAAGFVYWFKPHYKAPKAPSLDAAVAVLVKPLDTDHDGVPDSLDKCPTIAGLPEFNGCPDSDGDGVPDDEDECPLVPGLKQFNGCPDSDHDGIPDNKDKCPYQAGPADNGGCPIADRDHDGVPDAEDKCPDVPGTIANHGCPEIKKEIHEMAAQAAKDIYFDEAKATLKKNSYTSLNKIAKLMSEDKSLYLDIAGYTDNLGNNDLNITLSDKRANACRDYLISKGISADRLTAKGYGKDRPIADNTTEAGRAKNRRTELKLRNYK